MPIVKEKGNFPKWCELHYFEILRPRIGAAGKLTRRSQKERLMIAEGACRISLGTHTIEAAKGDLFEVDGPGGNIELQAVEEGTVLIRLCGEWGEETGSSGFIALEATNDTGNEGDPSDYKRNTAFDKHYLDCDVYYLIYEGNGIIVTEGKHYETAAGDCVVIGKGHHVDLPIVHKPLKAAYFEASLQGSKRRGHLWTHTHGPAEPESDRM